LCWIKFAVYSSFTSGGDGSWNPEVNSINEEGKGAQPEDFVAVTFGEVTSNVRKSRMKCMVKY